MSITVQDKTVITRRTITIDNVIFEACSGGINVSGYPISVPPVDEVEYGQICLTVLSILPAEYRQMLREIGSIHNLKIDLDPAQWRQGNQWLVRQLALRGNFTDKQAFNVPLMGEWFNSQGVFANCGGGGTLLYYDQWSQLSIIDVPATEIGEAK